MLSKSLPWDFVISTPQTIDVKKPGVYAFLTEDPYLEKIIMDQIPKSEIKFNIYSGQDFNRDFIEEHFVNLSFFSTADHIMIINAENISVDSISFLMDSSIDFSERFLLFFFSKSSKIFTDFTKNKDVIGTNVELPRFWEGEKLLAFCAKIKKRTLSREVSVFALNHLVHNFESFMWFIDLIEINFSDDQIDMNLLKELVKKERYDFFELIDLYHNNPKSFLAEMIKREVDYDWFRSMTSFLQGHLLKVLYPDEILSKAKPNKYEQSILLLSEKLDRVKVKKDLQLFSELEIMSKSSDPFLRDRLRMEWLKKV